MTDQIKTPAHIVVIATCPSCSLQQALGVHLNAELIVSDEGSVLALKAKAKASKAEHVCGQLSLEEAARVVQPLADLARETGTDITIEHDGRTATIHGRQVDTETGEARPMTVSHEAFCQMTSRSTGRQCQRPERWLERYARGNLPDGVEIRDMSVCQVHGRQLEREGWTLVRELHPVVGYERLGLSAEIEGRKG